MTATPVRYSPAVRRAVMATLDRMRAERAGETVVGRAQARISEAVQFELAARAGTDPRDYAECLSNAIEDEKAAGRL